MSMLALIKVDIGPREKLGPSGKRTLNGLDAPRLLEGRQNVLQIVSSSLVVVVVVG